jgi:2-(1,2-epoxy-1,2-dihydrophenyl)acetyl-CoA isomerase
MSEPLLVELDGPVLTVTLNRPDKLNSFNEAMHLALRAAVERMEREAAVRAMLLTGAGKGFCAGQDLGDRNLAADQEIDLGATIEEFYNPLVRRLRALEKPIVCAVNGVAAGAGANLALACDIVLAARSARFIQAFCRIGLVPDSGGTYFLPRLIGEARARALALTGEAVSAEQALAWGLIWRVVDDEQLLPEAKALAQRLAEAPTKGLGLIKRALNASFANDLDHQLDLERDLQREAGRTADYREGVAAFVAKRPAVFRGA